MSSFIAPQATTVAAFRVAGIAVRTTNAAEADPASARIGARQAGVGVVEDVLVGARACSQRVGVARQQPEIG